MTKRIINLTLSAVVVEIEDVLETYPYHPYRQLFSIPDLRQELIAYVLSRVSNRYVAVDEKQQPSFKSLHLLTEETLCIKVLIHKGIEKILYKKEQQISQRIPGVVDPSFAPSNWFG